MTEIIRALSWKEPFASLMLPPYNKIETRTWDTKYRGLVLICASKQAYSLKQIIDICGSNQTERVLKALDEIHHGIENSKRFCGHAIAVGRLVESRLMKPSDEDKCFVNHYNNLYCHVYEDVRAIQPFPWKGSQGWRILTEEQKQQIIFI